MAGRVSQQAKATSGGQVNQVAGDQHQHQHFYAGDGSGPRLVVSLPPPPAHLVGRAEKIDALLELLAPGDQVVSSIVVSAVHGLGGIGKTALALHAAHEAVERGWFPGGALFVTMRGYDPAGPMTAAQAVGKLLRALLGGHDDLPSTAEGQVGLYRSELVRRARNGQRILILVDDVSSAGQVLPLVPAHPHRLLVTSRDSLASPELGAQGTSLINLGELASGPAAELIAAVMTRARPSDQRSVREAGALAEVAEHCGYLPLALQIAAALLVGDPGLPVASLADDLADERTRLDRLHHVDGSGHSLAVRAAFELSYRRLPTDRQQLFRLLSLNPGPHTCTDAAASLTSTPADQMRPALAALAEAGLLTESAAGSGQWRMHDLVAVYAADLAHDHDIGFREEAVTRLLEYYQATTDAADDHLRALPGQPVPDRFSGRDEALVWLDAERLNLTAALSLAATTHPHIAVALAGSLVKFLYWRRHFDEALTAGRHALTAARRIGDRHREGAALNNLGAALQEVRRFDEAIDAHTQAA
ncbi:NB-ARC domain-containing protein, partial [Nonomuraea sp. NPDC004297]